jgi:radical SAM superfamily enzyme YgiQ (UPF0313 family)
LKICLVPYPIIGDSRPDTIDQKQLYPYIPLGLLTLSTLLEQAGHEVTILDLAWETNSGLEKLTLRNPQDVALLIQSKVPELVGFSTICSSYPLSVKWAEFFRHLSPNTPILFGGPQATATDEQTLRAFPWVDMVLRGEAENSIVPLVTCLQSGSDLTTVSGLTWRSGNQIIRNPDAPIVIDLDTLPFPAYHLYPMEQLVKYNNAGISPFHQPFSLEAGRGCPFSCSFCSTSSFFQHKYRTKSVGRLIDEMVTLHTQYGLEGFNLSHDLFTFNNAYLLEFCQRLRERDPQKTLKWGCSSRIDTIDQKILVEMAAAGCVRIFYGIETGSQQMQRLIGKNLLVQRVRSVIKETRSTGIRATTSFICGFPQERPEDLSATLALAVDMIYLGVDQVQLHLLAPLPGSELIRTFGNTLRYDGQWSDVSCGRLSQDEQELVLSWPNIFPSFYYFETPYINHDMLRALSTTFAYFPRLLAGVSAGNINLTSVFEHWPEWFHTHIKCIPEYYSPQRFLLDFLQFLQESLNTNTLMTPDLNNIIRYYAVVERVVLTPENAPIVSERFNCDVLALMQHLVDGKPLTGEALQPTIYLFWKSNGKVIIKRLTPALAELLRVPQP